MTLSLAETRFFQGFPEAALASLENETDIRQFRRHTQIISRGDESHALYVLLEGAAQAFTDDENGNEFVVNVFRPGDCFGELGVIDKQPRTASVITTTATRCRVIPGSLLMNLVLQDQQTTLAILRLLVGRIREMTDDASALALMSVYGRISRLLQQEATAGSDSPVTGRLTHQEIANRIGASREMVSKVLKDLQTGGYIEVEDHRITLRKTLPQRW